MKKENKQNKSRACTQFFVHCWTIIFHVVPIVCIVCSFLTEPSKNGIIISIHQTNLKILHKDRYRVKRFWISLKLNLDKQEALKIEMLTTDWPAAQSRWAWPGRQSRYRGYIWAGWPTTWIDASAKEGSRTPRILLQGCSASPPADGERTCVKGPEGEAHGKMERDRALASPTRNWGLGSSTDSAGVSSVPHLYASSAPLLFHRSRNRVAHTTLNSANTTQQMSRLVWKKPRTNTQML